MIEIIEVCTVAFMKARNSLVVWCREKRTIEKKHWKKTENGKNIYFKVLANRLVNIDTNDPCQTTKKLFMDHLLSNGLHEKVI